MTTVDEVRNALDNYWKWLRDNTELKSTGKDWVEIVTPFLNRDNDYLEVYTKKEGDKFLLTDGGKIIQGLIMSGCNLTPKRKKMMLQTLRGLGVSLEDDGKSLAVRAAPGEFGQKKHILIQAMLSVDDLYFNATQSGRSLGLFSDEVSTWLEKKKIRNTPSVSFTGKSGYIHTMDFVIPAFAREPERVLRLMNSPSRNSVQLLAFSWMDTASNRPTESKLYAIMNDEYEPKIDTTPLTNYGIVPMEWSLRENFAKELSA